MVIRHSGGILSLDMATATGWCFGLPIEPWEGLHFGLWRLPAPTEAGRQFAAFENELLDVIDQFRPGLVVYEASLPPRFTGDAHHVAELLIGLQAMVEVSCYRHEIEARKEYPQTVRAKIMGQGRMTTKEKEGGAVCRFLATKGIETGDHNVADAILQWMYAARLRAA